MDRKAPPRATKVKPKLTVRCGSCGHPLGNPLTHRCVTHTDFRKRQRAASKPTLKPASTGNAHDYTSCDDDDCSRFQCRVYKEGRANGVEEGRQHGYAEGYAKGERDGYDQGFPDGISACPLPHQG